MPSLHAITLVIEFADLIYFKRVVTYFLKDELKKGGEMTISIHNNASALQAFARQINVSANNVANIFSDEFKASTAHNTQDKNSGVTTTISTSMASGPLVEDPIKNDGTLKELSNTDLAKETVTQISAQHGFNANAKIISTYDETIGSLIETIG